MFAVEPRVIFWCVVAMEFLALASVMLARRSEGSPRQTCCQCLFFASLALVGAATMLTLGLGSGYWPLCGATLSAMALGATLDLRRSQSVTAC